MAIGIDQPNPSIVKAKILETWTIPEGLYKEMVDLETNIVLRIERDGNIR
jgi:hypothetical protein